MECHTNKGFSIFMAMLFPFQNIDKGIKKGFAGRLKRDLVFFEICRGFGSIPLEMDALERMANVHDMEDMKTYIQCQYDLIRRR